MPRKMLKALFGGMDGPFPWALALALCVAMAGVCTNMTVLFPFVPFLVQDLGSASALLLLTPAGCPGLAPPAACLTGWGGLTLSGLPAVPTAVCCQWWRIRASLATTLGG